MRRVRQWSTARRNTRSRRSGMTVFEIAVAAVVLGAVVTTSAQLVQWSAAAHQVALKRRCALEAATTVLDRISAREWSVINPESVKNISLHPEVKEFLADPVVAVRMVEEGQNPRGKKITVEISWGERAGTRTHQVQLTTWVFQPGSEK
jgi:hypothetical protein